MRTIVTGGGTGGHIFPALEIAHAVKHKFPTADVVFVGNSKSLEETMATAAGLRFHGIPTKKLVGQSPFNKLKALYILNLAILRSLLFLLNKRPAAVIGVGGYVSAPMIIASFLLGIKRYVCEQNVVPGLTNRWLGKLATKVFISFEDSRRYFSAQKTFLTGNPVRAAFRNAAPKKEHQGLRILVTGGSLGARFLNHHVPRALAKIKASCPHVSITHQTGKHDYEAVNSSYRDANLSASVVSFISDMPQAFANHDLLISRAGATVCAEIMASGMPAILIPYPYANAHQQHNAYALSNQGAGITIIEDQNFTDRLASTIKDLYSEPKKLRELGNKAQALGATDASSAIVNHIFHN